MKYIVTNTFKVGNNTSVTIKGNGAGLKNGIKFIGDDEKQYCILSVAMVNSQNLESSTLLIEGEFKLNSFDI